MSNSGKLVKKILLARKYIPYFRVNMFLYYYFIIEGPTFLATQENKKNVVLPHETGAFLPNKKLKNY